MIEVLIDDKVIEVNPELTIEKYQKIQKNLYRYNNQTEILALYLDLSVDELKNLPYDQIKFTEELLSAHLLDAKTNELVFTFRHKGKSYGLENDWYNMKWGQFVDLEIFSQPDKIIESIHILMALLYRPITIENKKEYKIEPYKSEDILPRASEFLSLPVNYWFGVAQFFFLISNAYTTNLSNSLKAKMMIEKLIKPLRKILPAWLLPKPPHDFILNSLSTSQTKTLQNIL
jgi:hypothetical protein